MDLTPVSVPDYLAREDRSEIRHEYFDGAVFPMRAEAPPHDTLARNLISRMEQAPSSHGCRIFPQGMKVHVPAGNCFYYPDVVGTCDSADGGASYLTRPCFVIEVVSPYTVRTDQSEKCPEYLSLASLDEYVLVYQSLMRVAVHRASLFDGPVEFLERPDDVLKLTCVGVGITLQDIYAGV